MLTDRQRAMLGMLINTNRPLRSDLTALDGAFRDLCRLGLARPKFSAADGLLYFVVTDRGRLEHAAASDPKPQGDAATS